MVYLDTTGLPPEVAEQAELVKQFMAGLGTGATGGEAAAGTTAQADQAQQTQHAQEQAQAAAGQQAADSGFNVEGQQGVQQAAQQQPTDNQQQQAQPQTDEAAEQRYRVLQGIHRADVARLGQQVKDLQAELESLRSSGQQSSTSTATNADSAATAAHNGDNHDEGNLDDLLEAAEIEADYPRIRELRAKIRERDRQTLLKEFEPIRQQVSTTANERYVSDLNSLATGWDKARNNPAFVEFLQQPAPFTGVPLFEILNQADSQRDAVRVSEIYNAFLQQQGQHTASGQSDTATTGTQRTLPASMVAPPRTAGGSGPTPQPKTVTREQLETAASDVGKGLMTADAYTALQNQYLQQSVFKQ